MKYVLEELVTIGIWIWFKIIAENVYREEDIFSKKIEGMDIIINRKCSEFKI